MELRYTVCDVCNPKGSLHPPEGEGLYDGSMKYAKECGWKPFRDGSGIERHICLKCQEKMPL